MIKFKKDLICVEQRSKLQQSNALLGLIKNEHNTLTI